MDPDDATIEWDAPGAEFVEVIISGGESDFDVIVPGSITRLDVPPQVFEPDTEYDIELLSIAENGNRTITRSSFVTSSGDDDDEAEEDEAEEDEGDEDEEDEDEEDEEDEDDE